MSASQNNCFSLSFGLDEGILTKILTAMYCQEYIFLSILERILVRILGRIYNFMSLSFFPQMGDHDLRLQLCWMRNAAATGFA
jgi:hypothetical protein